MAYVCRYCGQNLKARSSLHEHEGRHEKKSPFTCCGHMLFNRTAFDEHRASKHSGPKMYKCDVCEKVFASKRLLRKHFDIHKERRWTCEDCKNKFSSRSDLRDHLDSHKGTKRHICVCGKAYRYHQGLTNHKCKCSVLKLKV